MGAERRAMGRWAVLLNAAQWRGAERKKGWGWCGRVHVEAGEG
jgi:hypothetical protein